MKKYFLEMFDKTTDISMEAIVLHLIVALALGLLIYLSYFLSHNGTIYSRKFNTSLLVLTLLTCTVMTVIGSNLAMSLGMVGALSIVRFRTAIKDSRDTVYIFWTIIVGICCGAGDYFVATMGSIMVFLVLLVLGRIKTDNRQLIIIRAARNQQQKLEALIFTYLDRKAILRARNTTDTSVEVIYEISKRLLDKAERNNDKSLTDSIYDLGGIEYFNLVVQNDEISS